jgi:hypothetical protein
MVDEVRPTSGAALDELAVLPPAVVAVEEDFLLELQDVATRTPARTSGTIHLTRILTNPRTEPV